MIRCALTVANTLAAQTLTHSLIHAVLNNRIVILTKEFTHSKSPEYIARVLFLYTRSRSLCCRTNTSSCRCLHTIPHRAPLCVHEIVLYSSFIHMRTLLCVHEIFSFFIFGVYHDVTMSTTAKCSHMSVCVCV